MRLNLMAFSPVPVPLPEMTGQKYPKLQLLTVEELLIEGKGIEHPPWAEDRTFKKASKAATVSTEKNLTLFEMDEDE